MRRYWFVDARISRPELVCAYLHVERICPAGGRKVNPSLYWTTRGSKSVSSAKRPTRVMLSRLQP